PLLIWWTPLCLIRQILTRRFRLYAYPGSQQTECAGAVIHQKWHAAVHTHPGDNMYVATAIPALWKRLTQPAGYSFRHPGMSA
ncbi:hypothetical protein OSL47_12340, partial [Escherichia coli]|nr:hypothetical protein [Escherichia coli]